MAGRGALTIALAKSVADSCGDATMLRRGTTNRGRPARSLGGAGESRRSHSSRRCASPHRGTEVHMSNITVDAIIGEPEVLEDEVTAAQIALAAGVESDPAWLRLKESATRL